MRRLADIVEDVKHLSPEEQKELSAILRYIHIDERRNEISKNHQISLDELEAGRLKFYDKAEDVLNALNRD